MPSLGLGLRVESPNGGGGAAPVSTSFIMSWKTDNTGTSTDTQITVPLKYSNNVDIDWGDGNVNEGVTGAITHTYDAAGTYTVTMDGTITGMRFDDSGDKLKIIEISNWGDFRFGTWSDSFQGCKNLTCTATDVLVFAGNENFDEQFEDCYLFDYDFSGCDWSNIANFNQAFYHCRAFTNGGSALPDIDSATNVATMLNDSIYSSSMDFLNASSLTSLGSMLAFNDSFDHSLATMDITGLSSSGLTNFMIGCDGLSTANYDATLIGWDAQGAIVSGLAPNMGGSTYTLGSAAQVARTNLVAKGMTFTDGGGV